MTDAGEIPVGHDHCGCDARKPVTEKICGACSARVDLEMRAAWPKNEHKPVGQRS